MKKKDPSEAILRLATRLALQEIRTRARHRYVYTSNYTTRCDITKLGHHPRVIVLSYICPATPRRDVRGCPVHTHNDSPCYRLTYKGLSAEWEKGELSCCVLHARKVEQGQAHQFSSGKYIGNSIGFWKGHRSAGGARFINNVNRHILLHWHTLTRNSRHVYISLLSRDYDRGLRIRSGRTYVKIIAPINTELVMKCLAKIKLCRAKNFSTFVDMFSF